MIADPWRSELHAYLGGILRDMHVVPEAINGPGDHVHILVGLKATHMLAEVCDRSNAVRRCGSISTAFHSSNGRKDMESFPAVGGSLVVSALTLKARKNITE